MRAIRVHQFGGPDVLAFEDVADPVPGPGEVLIDIAAIGVNPVDTYIRAGLYPALPGLPYTPGGDAAGTVAACGDGAVGYAPGDRVYTAAVKAERQTFAMAERAAVTASEVYPLPDAVDFTAGAYGKIILRPGTD